MSIFKKLGLSKKETLRSQLGFSEQLRKHGKQPDSSPQQYKKLGYPAWAVKEMGYSLEEMMEGGYTARALKNAGFSLQNVEDACKSQAKQ